MSRKLPSLPRHVEGDVCTYDVIVGKSDGSLHAEFKNCEGMHDSTSAKPAIYIDETLPSWWRWQTFFHEVLHGVEEEMGLDLRDGKTGDVERLALGLYRMWRRNGWKLPGE